jgi:SAM-dependent methyltransferase
MTLHNTSVERRSLRVRARGSIARRGITGTATYGAVTFGHRVRRYAFYLAESAFDAWHGVDTRGIFHHDESAVRGDPVFTHAKHYGGTYPRSFRRYVRSLDIDYKNFAFVDLGSGKGKALLLAAEYPFRRVIGVELWEPWADDARRNLATARRFKSSAGAIELVLGDAATYEYPHEPLVVYVHNSFDEVLMDIVVTALQDSLVRAPRDLYLIYHGPWQRHVTDGVTVWEPISEYRKCVIYRATPESVRAGTATSWDARESIDTTKT